MVKYQYEFHGNIKQWDEGIPLGNGFLGTLVWGSPQRLRFALDRSDIWDTTPCPEIKNEEFSYPSMVNMVREKNLEKIRQVFDGPYNHLIPSKLPVGAIVLSFQENKADSVLDLQSATMKMKCAEVVLQGFVHANKRVGFIRICCPRDRLSWSLEHPKYNTAKGSNSGLANSVDTAALEQLHYPAPEKKDNGKSRHFIQQVTENFSYGIFVEESSFQNETLLVYTVAASVDGVDWKKKAKQLLSEALADGYEKNVLEHEKWWKSFWDKSSIELPDSFMEKNWYMSNYLLASCSRKGGYPMALQGLWTADNGKLPPWKGDYHHDLNTELSYYHYLKANHLEEGEAFLDYLWNMRECGEKFAQDFYHVKGACLPATMTIDGQPLGGWGMYSLSPTMCIWLSQMFERYYRYTGDDEFLKDKAYPYMRDTGIFVQNLLEEKDGSLYLPISSSPEIHDDELESFLTPNSNFDLSLMRYLYSKLIFYAKKLKNGEEKRWEYLLERLPQLAINEKNVLMLSPDESLCESHRHLSHLMAIHPLRLLSFEDPKERQVIEASLDDLERLGKGAWVGYSFGWAAELYAISKNGNAAAYQLKTFWECFCSDNGFHLNGDFKNRGVTASHYRPFTLEANMCAADALQEMLLYSEDGVMELFPALPDEWIPKRTGFHHLRGEMGCLVSAVCEDCKLLRLEIKFTKDVEILLKKNRICQGLYLNGRVEEMEEGYRIFGKAGEHVAYI